MLKLTVDGQERLFPRDYVARLVDKPIKSKAGRPKKRGRGRPKKDEKQHLYYSVPFKPGETGEYLDNHGTLMTQREHDCIFLLLQDLAIAEIDLTQESQRRELMGVISEALLYDHYGYLKNSNAFALLMKHLHDSEDFESWMKRFENAERKVKAVTTALEDEDLQTIKDQPLACIIPFEGSELE